MAGAATAFFLTTLTLTQRLTPNAKKNFSSEIPLFTAQNFTIGNFVSRIFCLPFLFSGIELGKNAFHLKKKAGNRIFFPLCVRS